MRSSRSGPDPGAANAVRALLEGLELSPSEIPLSHTSSLRGGQAFFSLGNECLDGVLLLSTSSTEIGSGVMGVRDGSERLYRLDFVVRGNIRGILPGRIVAVPSAATRGIVRKSVESIVWQTPRTGITLPHQFSGAFDDQQVPGPGEMFEGSPFEAIALALNDDGELRRRSIVLAEKKGLSLIPRIVTDRWGDSIRFQASMWVKSGELPLTYAARDYVEAVGLIAKHIKQVRRTFGGISF